MARPQAAQRTNAPTPPPAGEALRLFVAIELPWDVRRAVVDTMETLKRGAGEKALRWVRPEGIHLTLAFLGATEQARVPAITRALGDGVRSADPFPLTPLGVGSFGGRGRLRVVWIGVGGDGGALSDLAELVAAALAPLGYPRDARAFNAHLTLARVRDGAPPDDLSRIHDLLMSFDPTPAPSFTVDRVSLMQSLLGPGGAAYRQLATAPLLGDGAVADQR
ncbi:MAG TPA: RNA 2',3'-cyclic phosphodiesterase [Dehalococcoidia bacterium]|nr:RNA 2',3'-cyclic phosphodiesterase [Dehalococcoidia bacterium]